MKITSIEAIPFSIPYRRPLAFATGVLRSADHVLVRVHTDDGVSGVGEAVARPMVYGESQASIVTAIREWLEPALLGTDPLAVEYAWERTGWVIANNTARGAVDVALHDLRGHVTGLPAWRLLGGTCTALRVTRMLSMGAADEVADEARAAADEQGVTSFKVKVGTGLRSDVARVAAVRGAVGDAATIYVDANHGWSAEEAARALSAMTEFALDLVEEPNPAEDRLGRRRLADQLPIPVMADESAPTVADAARELSTGAARALSIKTTRTGFTESGRLVALARALGARTLIGNQADSMVGSAAALAFGAAHPAVAREPAELDLYTLFTDHLVVHPLEVVDGEMRPSDRPGTGVVIDEGKLAHYRVDERAGDR